MFLAVIIYLAAFAIVCGENPRCPPPPARCIRLSSPKDQILYNVNGNKLVMQYVAGKDLSLRCEGNMSLGDPALPTFSYEARAPHIHLVGCSLSNESLTTIFRKLGVSLPTFLMISRTSELIADHFKSLPLTGLDLADLSLESYALQALPNLTSLSLKNVTMSQDAWQFLPTGLTELNLINMGIEIIPETFLYNLQMLKRIVIKEDALTHIPDLTAIPSLHHIWISAPLETLPKLNHIENATLWHIKSAGNALDSAQCARLQELSAAAWSAHALPNHWLAECHSLKVLRLEWLPLKELPEDIFGTTKGLQSLIIRGCGLQSVPPTILANARNLKKLDLSHNVLMTLPDTLLNSLVALEELDFSHNKLDNTALEVSATVTSLQALSLAYNPLGDCCGTAGVSGLSHLTALKVLELGSSGQTRICTDWRLGMPYLARLGLNDNDIGALHGWELKTLRAQPSVIDLRRNPVYAVHYNKEDYEAVMAGEQFMEGAEVRFEIDSELECDCATYWFSLAITSRPGHVRLPNLRCRGGRKLSSVPSSLMTCALEAGDCVKGCDCARRFPDNATEVRCGREWDGLLPDYKPLALWAENANLKHIPRSPSIIELHLSGNNITHIESDDIVPSLRVLDVSHNTISSIENGVVTSLLAAGGKLLLSGNPLDCNCDAFMQLESMRSHRHQVLDYENATCSDGRPLSTFQPSCTTTPAWPAWAACVVAAVGVAAAVSAARSTRARQRLKRALTLPDALPNADCKYDAFVSFAHSDGAAVAEQLVKRLEAEKYKVCVHYRDWAPGELIPAQIIRSVAESRRTLTVITEAWSESAWAKREAGEAAARGRLVPVLVGGGSDLKATTTCLIWGEANFWEKLGKVLAR